MKLAVIFPGIRYSVSKPLLYYAGKLAASAGYTVMPVAYGDLPRDVKGDPVIMRLCITVACERAKEALRGVQWDDCESALFIGKSIGTTVAARYAREQGVPADLILLTPLEETFRFTSGTAIAFHGTADPWADTGAIKRACAVQGIPLYLTEGANHALETGNVKTDLSALTAIMAVMEKFIHNTCKDTVN